MSAGIGGMSPVAHIVSGHSEQFATLEKKKSLFALASLQKKKCNLKRVSMITAKRRGGWWLCNWRGKFQSHCSILSSHKKVFLSGCPVFSKYLWRGNKKLPMTVQKIFITRKEALLHLSRTGKQT